ncbi:ribosomal-protein-alanine N-acetyltransferase [bacterium]|nr:MAG: ribosomal-protein-alanine N-acetyltransferase [bacterium]
MSTFRLERLREEHLPAILRIEQASNSSPWSERSFRNELDHPYGLFLTALLEGEPIGYGGIWFVIDEAHITTIAIDGAQRGLGYGRRLMVTLLEEAKERGMACATLEVRAGNEPALRLYEGLGFVRSGRRKGYYPDNREDAVVMWLYDLQAWTSARP